jgi:hypothetical protein
MRALHTILSSRTKCLALLLALPVALAACNPEAPAARPDTPSAQASGTAVASAPSSPAASVDPVAASASAAGNPSAAPPLEAGLDAGAPLEASATAALEPPALLDTDGGTLPQTEDEPDSASPWFQQQLNSLVQAIVQDDPELARPFFFPVEAYQLVKAIDKPERDHKYRLWKNFVRDVHEYHRKLGDQPDKAELIAFEPRSERKKWMKPHSEGNKLGYWRMTRNRLRLRDARGDELRFEITSFISWRGEWYVVHLHGFK